MSLSRCVGACLALTRRRRCRHCSCRCISQKEMLVCRKLCRKLLKVIIILQNITDMELARQLSLPSFRSGTLLPPLDSESRDSYWKNSFSALLICKCHGFSFVHFRTLTSLYLQANTFSSDIYRQRQYRQHVLRVQATPVPTQQHRDVCT